MTHAIEAHGLRKTYPGGVEAVKGIDFEVPAGEVFGLLGPNGAGKSTTSGCSPPRSSRPRHGAAGGLRRRRLAAAGAKVAQRRVPGCSRRRRPERTGQPRAPHAAVGGPRGARPAQDRRAGRRSGAHGPDRPTGLELQRRSAPPARDRPRADVVPPGAVPRRADGRARPADPARAARRDRRPPRAGRADDRAHDPLSRRGAAAVRPGGDHPRGPSSRSTRPRRCSPGSDARSSSSASTAPAAALAALREQGIAAR